MERIYDILERIQSLWKELEVTKPNSSDYVAVLNQIRVLSDEYVALIDVPKRPTEPNNSLPAELGSLCKSGHESDHALLAQKKGLRHY